MVKEAALPGSRLSVPSSGGGAGGAEPGGGAGGMFYAHAGGSPAACRTETATNPTMARHKAPRDFAIRSLPQLKEKVDRRATLHLRLGNWQMEFAVVE